MSAGNVLAWTWFVFSNILAVVVGFMTHSSVPATIAVVVDVALISIEAFERWTGRG